MDKRETAYARSKCGRENLDERRGANNYTYSSAMNIPFLRFVEDVPTQKTAGITNEEAFSGRAYFNG